MAITPNDVFRDYVVDGVPSSGPHKPVKSEVRALLNAIMAGGGVNLVVGAGATGVFTVGDPDYAPETITYRPAGAGGEVVFAISSAVIQLNQDNIPLAKNPWGSGLAGSNITWKAPNPVSGDPDVPFLNIGFRNGGTGEVLFEGGFVGAIPSESLPATQFPIGFYTADSVNASQLRLFLASGDNVAVGMGTSAPSSEAQGAFLHMHAQGAAKIAHLHFSTDDSGSGGTDGASVGLFTDGALRLWHYENSRIVFGLQNAERARLTTTGLGIGGTPSERLHLIASAAGSITTRLRADAVNTTSGKTSTLQIAAQDNNAGTVRALFNMPGPLNGGTPNQGVLDFLTEDGSLRGATLDSIDANGGSRLLLYNRGGTARILLSAADTPTLNLSSATGEYRVNNVKVAGARQTGWSAATGTATRTSFATGSVTLPQLAERVKGLIDDLTTHGLIGA